MCDLIELKKNLVLLEKAGKDIDFKMTAALSKNLKKLRKMFELAEILLAEILVAEILVAEIFSFFEGRIRSPRGLEDIRNPSFAPTSRENASLPPALSSPSSSPSQLNSP